jgi:hypothetical protein
MHTSAPLSSVETARKLEGKGPSLGRRAKALAARISAWAVARADRIGGELVYRELSKLSDGELRDRGLSRASLARYVRHTAAEQNKR